MEWKQDMSVRHYRVTSNVGGYMFLAVQKCIDDSGWECCISQKKSFNQSVWQRSFPTQHSAQAACIINAIEKVKEIEKVFFQELQSYIL